MEGEGQEERPGRAAACIDRGGARGEAQALALGEVPGVLEVDVGVVYCISAGEQEEQGRPGRPCGEGCEGADRVLQRRPPSSSTIRAAPR